MKKRRILLFTGLSLSFVLLLSIPYLVPHTGALALVAWVPLLCLERVAEQSGQKHCFAWYYLSFLLWNLVTTFWVCNATWGGGIFASAANALQMAVVFGLFRRVKKRLNGVLPYLFLAAAWIAWEKYYLDWAEISWPWLVLGNAFAGSIRSIQWYEWTGTLGGSLWIWASNLSIFGILVSLSDGRWQQRFNPKARTAATVGLSLLLVGPPLVSAGIWQRTEEAGEPVEVLLVQPNIDPYHKFESLSQSEQDRIFLDLASPKARNGLLVIGPETFTSGVDAAAILASNETARNFSAFCAEYPGMQLIYGASTTSFGTPPSPTAGQWGSYWYERHNSAILTDGDGRTEIYHKSKLVPAVESTPYPRFFGPIETWFGGQLMGKDIGQAERSNLHLRRASGDIPIGCIICYESIYGNFCRDYVRKGASLLTIITNDAWWGDTPGYRQHLHYASLRAIETRRDIARCANTGVSALINQRGEIIAQTPWWEKATLEGVVNANTAETFFVRSGDIIGSLSVLVFCLLALAALVKRR